MGSVQRRWPSGLFNRITTDTKSWEVLDHKLIDGEWMPCLYYSPEWELWLVDELVQRNNRVEVFDCNPRDGGCDVAPIEIPIWDHAAGARASEWAPGTVALLERVDEFLAESGWEISLQH